MAATDATTATRSNAQKRVIAITTEAEDPVIFSGNPGRCNVYGRTRTGVEGEPWGFTTHYTLGNPTLGDCPVCRNHKPKGHSDHTWGEDCREAFKASRSSGSRGPRGARPPASADESAREVQAGAPPIEGAEEHAAGTDEHQDIFGRSHEEPELAGNSPEPPSIRFFSLSLRPFLAL